MQETGQSEAAHCRFRDPQLRPAPRPLCSDDLEPTMAPTCRCPAAGLGRGGCAPVAVAAPAVRHRSAGPGPSFGNPTCNRAAASAEGLRSVGGRCPCCHLYRSTIGAARRAGLSGHSSVQHIGRVLWPTQRGPRSRIPGSRAWRLQTLTRHRSIAHRPHRRGPTVHGNRPGSCCNSAHRTRPTGDRTICSNTWLSGRSSGAIAAFGERALQPRPRRHPWRRPAGVASPARPLPTQTGGTAAGGRNHPAAAQRRTF